MKTNALIVHANPKSNDTSHSWKILKTVQKEISIKSSIEVLDLYRDSNFPIIDESFFNSSMFPADGYLKDEFKHKMKVNIAKQFVKAHELIIITPFWTGLFPSFLKNWIDLLAEQDISLTVDSNDKLIGKFKGKVTLIQTCGGLMKDNSHNYGADLIRDNMNFYGATDFKSLIIEQVDKISDIKLEKMVIDFLMSIEKK
jgi:FMN-dependent NADH-azoreductase